MKIDERLLDEIAQGEVDAIREGLQDPELRQDPRFLASVRKFLKDNNLLVSPKTNGVDAIKQQMEKERLPIFDEDEEDDEGVVPIDKYL